MSNEPGTLRQLLSGESAAGQSMDEIERALASYLESAEQLQYQLPGKDVLTHEQAEEAEDIGVAGETDSVGVVTNHKLLFVLDSPEGTEVIELAHADIRGVETTGGLLKTVLVVEVWEAGEYRFRLSSSDSLDEAIEYIERASECWQFADALLDELAVLTRKLGDHIEAGRLDGAETVLGEAQTTIAELRERIGSDGFEETIGPRVDEAERKLYRTRMRAHIARAKTLVAEARHQTDATDYNGAYQRYDRAGTHLELALSIAEEQGFDEPTVARSELETIESRMRNLEVRPMALGRQATERARGTDHAEVAVEAWEEALGHYRDALTAGWGTPFEGSADTEEIRFLVEGAVGNLIEARREYAIELETQGDSDSEGGRSELARDRYERALEQLTAARNLAREFRSGDVEAIERQCDGIEWKLDTL
jgi:tetratricopeptide (TPR) repeat protein